MICWQLIFLQSKVNCGVYDGDRLPAQNWDWPRETWFQNRLRYLRKRDQVTHDDYQLDLKTASPRLPEYSLKKTAALKEFGHGMPTMFDRQRGQVPGLQ